MARLGFSENGHYILRGSVLKARIPRGQAPYRSLFYFIFYTMPMSVLLAKASQIANPKVKVRGDGARRHGPLWATKETLYYTAI